MPTISMQSGIFLKAMNATMFCVAKNKMKRIRPNQSGVYIKKEGKTCEFISTDSLRCSSFVCKNEIEGDDISFSIPGKTLEKIMKIIPRYLFSIENIIKIELDENKKKCNIFFISQEIFDEYKFHGGYKIESSILPNMDYVKNHIKKYKFIEINNFDPKLFINTLKNIIKLKYDNNRTQIEFTKNKMIISSGNIKLEIACQFQGNICLFINAKYFLDAICRFHGEFKILLEDSESPQVMHLLGSFAHVIFLLKTK